MMQPNNGSSFRVLAGACVTVMWLVSGCVPSRLGQAITYYADKTAVTDAAARHTDASPWYRFNTASLSALDDAIRQDDERRQRGMAETALREASGLCQVSFANEVERMPASAREELAAIAGTEASAAALNQHIARVANAALESDLRDVALLPQSGLREKLRYIRSGVEDLPDDKRRTERRVLYSWAALLTASGIAREEAKLPDKCAAKASKKFDRIAVWHPAENAGDSLIKRYAPIIAMEWPTRREYDASCDRIGAVRLTADDHRILVNIDAAQPTVYAYTSTAKINQQQLQQVNYVWWFSQRPEMSPDDPVAGHIDGAMLRVTLDANERPLFVESSLNCGCAHEVFVLDSVESAARSAFGPPLPGKRFAVENRVPGKHDVVVIDTFGDAGSTTRPLVLSAAGYHEVCQVQFNAAEVIGGMDVVENRTYRIADYDTLDRLPLGDGVGSMFGPDGLVHYAGRPEGRLLAPSGILSAGQPRKRGTQRIRWDDYLLDEPHLLEETLRVPLLDQE